jgi:hypothetical protein
MTRSTAFSLVLLFAVMTMASGCARDASTEGQPRVADPGMSSAVGPTGMSRDSKRYIANDPP